MPLSAHVGAHNIDVAAADPSLMICMLVAVPSSSRMWTNRLMVLTTSGRAVLLYEE